MAEKLCTLKKNRSNYYYGLGFDAGFNSASELLRTLTFDITIPCYGYDGGGLGSTWVHYANGGTSWYSRPITDGGWAEGAPYCDALIVSAAVTINNINHYQVTIGVKFTTGKIYGDSDYRGTQYITTRFKDGVVTNSGGASYMWSSQDQGVRCGVPYWTNVSTYTA